MGLVEVVLLSLKIVVWEMDSKGGRRTFVEGDRTDNFGDATKLTVEEGALSKFPVDGLREATTTISCTYSAYIVLLSRPTAAIYCCVRLDTSRAAQ